VNEMVTIPDKLESPAAALTAYQKLEAIEARLVAKWDHPSLIASGLCLPNLRENILRILGVPTNGEGRPLPGDDPVHVFERFKGTSLDKGLLPGTIKTILRADGISTQFYLLMSSKEHLATLPDMTAARLTRCENEKVRLIKIVAAEGFD
jgi:hypothetical protein